MGAFVFAAQMVNFPVGSGTSGHLSGGVLLAVLLGPHVAALVMAAILTVQCLVFTDGGILALGCNIFNMGLVGPYVGWLAYRAIIGRPDREKGAGRLYLASFTAALLAVAASAAMVPVQIVLSRQLAVPFSVAFPLMVGVHILIGAVEGLSTFAVLAYLVQARPDVLEVRVPGQARLSRRAVVTSIAVFAFVAGGLGALVASGLPDGLDWLCETKGYVKAAHPAMPPLSEAHAKLAPLPDYSGGENAPAYWKPVAGILGTGATLGVVYLIALAVRRRMPAHAHPHAHQH
jgi:cobalt/nickel transport system permease protein